MKYQGQKLSYLNIKDYIEYDQNEAWAAMTRSNLAGPPTKNADSLTIKDRQMHYIYAKSLKLRGDNYAQVLNENIFMLWAIKQMIIIN